MTRKGPGVRIPLSPPPKNNKRHGQMSVSFLWHRPNKQARLFIPACCHKKLRILLLLFLGEASPSREHRARSAKVIPRVIPCVPGHTERSFPLKGTPSTQCEGNPVRSRSRGAKPPLIPTRAIPGRVGSSFRMALSRKVQNNRDIHGSYT